MTSVIVPPVDLAPGMPSRVVTISATDVTEGGQSLEGQMVRFALSDTLDVTSGGDVIAKTQAEVVLDANGEGRIRLPVYNENVRTWCGQDWAILVTATWGSQKAIRVPAGTSSIALSALPPVRPLRGREKQWAITGASVTVTEGGSWDASLNLSGGILNLGLTVPPGGVDWYKGRLANGADPDDLDVGSKSGLYRLAAADDHPNIPPALANVDAGLRVSATGFSGEQELFSYASRVSYKRVMTNAWSSPRGWSSWERTDPHAQASIRDVDLDGFFTPGDYSVSATNGVTNFPPQVSGTTSRLEVRRITSARTEQTWITGAGIRIRRRSSGSSWEPWIMLEDPRLSEVKIFATQADALAWEEANPGSTALYVGVAQ